MPVVAKLTEAGYVDAQARDPDHAGDATWHWRWHGREISLRIDYIFHRPPLTTLDASVFAEGPSDHYPLVATLAWQAEPSREATGGRQASSRTSR